ncbi:hypothetical protein [Clostridium sartagoforme]|uniref:hypothetical protein n=1 Tax=Clostridium sartagoforme TaxID=84031 RepID=UPI0012FC7AB8|nr:hypothetical protein [Clostridium sartagoforme]
MCIIKINLSGDEFAMTCNSNNRFYNDYTDYDNEYYDDNNYNKKNNHENDYFDRCYKEQESNKHDRCCKNNDDYDKHDCKHHDKCCKKQENNHDNKCNNKKPASCYICCICCKKVHDDKCDKKSNKYDYEDYFNWCKYNHENSRECK